MRHAGWLAPILRESCPRWLQEVLLVAERRLPMALATAPCTGGVLRIYRLGQPWVVLGRRQRPLRRDRLRSEGTAVQTVWFLDASVLGARLGVHEHPNE